MGKTVFNGVTELIALSSVALYDDALLVIALSACTSETPLLSMEELAALGFNCAMLGIDTLMHAAKAVEAVLLDMKTGRFARRNDGMDFEDYKRLVGYDNWERIDDRFAPPQ